VSFSATVALLDAAFVRSPGTVTDVLITVMSKSNTMRASMFDWMRKISAVVVLLFQVGRLLTGKTPAMCAIPAWELKSSNSAMVRWLALPAVSSMSSTWVVRLTNSLFVLEA